MVDELEQVKWNKQSTVLMRQLDFCLLQLILHLLVGAVREVIHLTWLCHMLSIKQGKAAFIP